MKGEKLSKTRIAYGCLVSSLNDIEIRSDVTFDQLRPIFQQSDIPSE